MGKLYRPRKGPVLGIFFRSRKNFPVVGKFIPVKEELSGGGKNFPCPVVGKFFSLVEKIFTW